MPVLSVRPEERRLIPYEVQALYELGRISKEQLDNYVKTRSEEYLRSYEENLRTDPARQVGNLAAPVEKEAPWPDSSPVQYSALDTLKDTVVGLQTSTVGGLVNLGNLAAQGISTQGEWAGRFMEATGLPQVGKPLREFSDTYGDVASRETGAYREALQGVASERKSEGLKQSELALGNLLGSKGFKDLPITEQASQIAKFIGGNKKLAAYMATESLGGLATGGPLAKAANILRGSSVASYVAARLAGGGILAGQELAGIQSDVYNMVYQETGSADQASKAASTAATDPLVLLAAGIDVFTGAEATSLITGAQKAARRATRPTLTGVMAAGTKAGAVEGGGEFFQEGAQARAENLAFGRPEWEGVAGRATLGTLVGAPMGATVGGISNVVETTQQAKDAEARIAQGKAVYENIAKSGADVNTLSEARTAIARSLGLEADTIEDAQTLANRFKQNDVPSKVRAKAVAETVMTGDPAFDAGQKAAQQTFQLAEQYKPVEATVTQFEPLARRPATPVQGNLGSFTVEAPVAKETLTERGLKKANLRLDKDTRMLDTEIANLRSQLGTKVDPITGVDPVRAQLAEAETLREGIARERLRTAEKAKPAEPTPYAKEMRRFQEQPKVEVNAKIPEAPKISRAESITNKVAEEVAAKTKKELPENTRERVTEVASLAEQELTFSGALRGLDEKAADAAVLAKTREYLASGEKEADIEKRVTDIRKKRDADFEAFAKETATTLKNHDEVLKTLDRNLGKDVVDGLVRSDKVRVLSDFQRAEFARTQEERDLGQGVYIDKDGIIYLNAANLNKKDENGDLKREIAMAVLAHEQGHTKNFRTEDGKRVPVLKGLAGDAAYDALNKAIADSAKGTGRIADIAKRAQERAQSGVEVAQKAGRQVELKDELPQYFVEELVNSYDGPLGPFRKFIDETSAKARDIINRSPLKMDIRPQDLGWMVKQDLIAESKTEKTTGTKQAKFSYLGQQAKGADQVLLQKAKEMHSRGESAEKIRKETGWFLNQWDNAWRFEVSDKDAKLKIAFKDIPESELLGETKALLLKEILDHPTLFENYPELENVEFIKRNGFFDFGTLQGWYNDEQNRIGITPYAKDPLGTLLHEIQHWIQGVEGFGLGGNESSAFASLPNEAKATLATDALKQTETSLESDISARDAYTATLNNKDLLALAEEALSLRDNRDLPFLEKSSAVNQISNRVKSVLGEGFGANEVVKYMHYGFHKDMDGFKQDFERRAKQATESAAKNTKTLAAIKSGDTAALLEVLKRTGKAYKFYRSLLGEIEARDVTNRKDLDVGDRVVTSPYEKTMIEDSINPSDVIVVKEPQKGRVNFSLGTKEATGFKEAKKQGKTFTSPVTGEEIFEIPDTDMKVNAGILRAANGKPIDLETALVHDELFKQWPFLRKDVKIKTTDKFALNEAEYDPRTKTITISNQNIDNIYNYALSAEAKKEARKDISKTVLHEITHAIQDKIGAEMGSNPTFEMYEYVADKLRNMNNNKLAAEYSRVLNAVQRNRGNVDKLFKGISKLRDQWEAKGKKWPDTYTDLDIHIANDPALAGQIMPFVKGLGLNNLRELHETYNFLRQAKNAGYWAYMANRGEVTARAVAHVFDGKFATLKEAEEAVAKQFGELSTQGNSKAAFQTFEKQAPQMKAKPAVLMSLGATIEVDGKTRPTTNSKGQPIADSVESARNFWRWFGDSKVVDTQGRPLVVYHGTREDFDEFRPGTLGDIWFTDDPGSASEFSKDIGNEEGTSLSQKSNVVSVYISIKDPQQIEAGGSKYNRLWEVTGGKDRETLILDAQDANKDGVVFKNMRDPENISNVYVAFRPEQIKSVNNQGSWDKNDPRILMSLGEAVEVDGVQRPTTNSKGQSIADSVESARNFWRWFGDSKVVDKTGNPVVMYHGTNKTEDGKAFSVFDAYGSNYGLFGQGAYFTDDPGIASEYTSKGRGESPTVYPVYMAINNPIDMDAVADPAVWKKTYRDVDFEEFKPEGNTNESYYRAVEDYLSYEGLPRYEGAEIIQDGLRNMGHDGITHIGGGRVRSEGKRHRVFIAFDPEQIKSVNNSGTWSKEDPRILFSLAGDVKEKAQIASEAAKEKTSVAWKYLQGALWDMRPAKFKIAEEMRDGYVRYIEQKGREMAQRMVEAANKDGITLDALKEAWGQAREYGVLGDTGSAKVNALMQAMRDEIDSLSMQIEEVYDESGTPLSDKMKETFNKNLFSYISRSFEIDFNKGWSKKLLRAAKKDPNSKEATIINNLRSWLNDEIVARLESLELLDDKQIKSLYKRLIDEDVEGKSVETMTKALESFKGNLKSEELVDILQNDVLRLSKVSGVGNYYRGAARNEGILQKKTNIPSPILAAMGERVGPAESFLTTIVRQGSLFAQTKMLADFRKAMPEAFTTDQTPENTVRIEDKQGKYGPLAGLYTTPAMKEYIEEKITQEEKMDALMTNLHSAYAQEELATRLVKGGLKNLARVSGVYKVWSIMTNTANYLYNVVNGAASLARYNTLGTVYGMDYVDKEGNKIPLHKWFPELAADFLWRGSVTGTSSHELYGLAVTANFVGSAMSGDIKEAFLDTIRETVEGKKPGMIKSGWRRATWLADAWFSGPEALPNILGVVVESNYLRKLWEAQALDFTHDELMAAAADRVKRNAISRDRAIPGAKFLDKYAAQAFLTFFTETVRAPMQTAYDAVMDIKESNRPDLSPKAKKMMRGHAAAHLAGAATTAAAIYGITQAIALAFGRPFGTEDDEDPEGLEEDLRDRPEDLIVIGTDKDGRKLVFDLSKLNTYSLITNVVREAAQGNLEGAGRQAKSFLFANPLPQKVWTELTDNYGEAGKSDVAIAVNNAIADTPLGQVVDPTTVNELVKVMSMFTPGFIKDPKKALENAQGLQENLALGFVGAGARPVAYQPVKTLRYQMGTALDELETARSKLNAAMRTKDASEKLIKQEMRRYYNAERDLILKNRPLVQAALKNDVSAKELRQLFKFLGANKHLNEQMLSNKPYKPTAMHKNWLTMSQKLATFGEPEKVKEEQGMIYTQNKAAYHKLFKEIYGDKE